MTKTFKRISIFLAIVIIGLACAFPVLAASNDEHASNTAVTISEDTAVNDNALKVGKGIAAAAVVAIVAAAGAIGMAMAISKSVESMARQPEASGEIRTSLMLGLVFIETAIIYALIVAILVVFVL